MKKINLKINILMLTLLSVVFACTEVELTSPKGAKGQDGLSAYETWVKRVKDGLEPNWKGGDTEADFILFLTGKKGENGASAYEEWKKMIANGTVNNPHNTSKKWDKDRNSMQDFFYFLTGPKGAKGEDGPAGQNGTNGAAGQNGTNGIDGINAYEVWKTEVAKGKLPNPHSDVDGYSGEFWPTDKVELSDFWFYLTGKNGKNSEKLISDYIMSFKIVQTEKDGPGYNVQTGDAVIRITNRDNKPLEEGSKIKFGTDFGLAAEKSYTVKDNGTIVIPREDLSDNGKDFEKRTARAEVTDIKDGGKYQTNIFTYPTKIEVQESRWDIWNDYAEGIIRFAPKIIYKIDAAGATSEVEINQKKYTKGYEDIYQEWVDATADQRFVFKLNTCNEDGSNVNENDARTAPNWWAGYGTLAARRQLIKEDENDNQKVGYLFQNDSGRLFEANSYYVQTNETKYFFGISGTAQSPIVEVPSMPRVPIVETFDYKESEGKVAIKITELTESNRGKKVSGFSMDGNVLRPTLERFPDNEEVHITLTKANVSSVGTATIGGRNMEIPLSLRKEDLQGLTVKIESPFTFRAPGNGNEAHLQNQQPHLRPVVLGTLKIVDDVLVIHVASDLAGNDNTYIGPNGKFTK